MLMLLQPMPSSNFLKSGSAAEGLQQTLALQIIEQGVADEYSLRDSLRSTPSAFELKAVVTKLGQRIKITEHLDRHLSATP